MNLVVQPEDGLTSILAALKRARSRIELTIFRFDQDELQKALEQAVVRGVKVHALIAHQAAGEGKRLRKLELELLEKGVTVSRTGDDLIRYHDKLLLIDREMLYTLGFNWARLDIVKSRSMAIATRHARLVQEGVKLFHADSIRQPYTAEHDCFVVSPENARTALSKFIKSARKELLIYDTKISDRQMIALLADRVKAGVEIRIIGKLTKKIDGVKVDKLPDLRLHLRAMLRDGQEVFVGSQSLRSLELDKRREVGIIVKNRGVAKRFRYVFEQDWAKTGIAREIKKAAEKNEKRDKATDENGKDDKGKEKMAAAS